MDYYVNKMQGFMKDVFFLQVCNGSNLQQTVVFEFKFSSSFAVYYSFTSSFHFQFIQHSGSLFAVLSK